MKTRAIGGRIARERKRRNITREQVSREIDTKPSPQLVRMWELGFAEPRPANREAIEKWLAGSAK